VIIVSVSVSLLSTVSALPNIVTTSYIMKSQCSG